MRISLIIPAYNEEENICSVIKKVPSVVDEVIVVDDGSTDKTSEAVSKHDVKLVRHEKNLGKGKALRTGAESSTGEVLVFMDGDSQHDPSEIRSLIRPVLNGESDIVLGYRDLGDAPLVRKFSNFLAKFAIKVFAEQDVKDPLCGFRAIRKDAFDKLNLTMGGYEVEFDIIFEVLKNGLRVTNRPVSVNYDTKKSSITAVDNAKIILFVLKKFIKKD